MSVVAVYGSIRGCLLPISACAYLGTRARGLLTMWHAPYARYSGTFKHERMDGPTVDIGVEIIPTRAINPPSVLLWVVSATERVTEGLPASKRAPSSSVIL